MSDLPKLLADAERRYAALKIDATHLADAMQQAAVVELHPDLAAAGKIRALLLRMQRTLAAHEEDHAAQ